MVRVKTVPEVVRELGVTEQNSYRRKRECGGSACSGSSTPMRPSICTLDRMAAVTIYFTMITPTASLPSV